MKPYYEHGGITIYHGDALEVSSALGSDIDLVLTDPPYGIDFDTDYRRFSSGFDVEGKVHRPVHGDSKPFDPTPWLHYGRVILWGANCFSDKLPMGSWLIWDKRHANGTAFLSDAEAAWTNHGTGIYIYSQTWQGCLRSEPIDHPTQKPTALMSWCLNRVKTARIILDPYMGSGTTLVAARAAGLTGIGIEIDERYCEIAANRLRQERLPFTELMGTAMRDADEAAEAWLRSDEPKLFP